MKPDDFAAVRDYLYSLKNHGAKYGIERMRLLVDELGHPELRYPVIHVAGTNGKGSTTAMLEAIFRSAGYRTGMFTSPHLVYQGERVQVDRTILSHAAIVAYTRRLRPVAERLAARDPDDHPSFFEFMTAMAFLRFAEAAVDLAVIETGLGGRLDATNVVRPALCVITSIGRDHQEILGDTLEAIAAEKAGILKAGVPVVLGSLPSEAEAVVIARANELGCAVHRVSERFGTRVDDYPESALPGTYQRINAATATLAAEVLQGAFPKLGSTAIARGLATVEWAGRWDRREFGGRTVILDSTHNAEGGVYLRENLQALIAASGGARPVVVVGTLGMTRARDLMPIVAEFARELILVRPKQPRACLIEELRAALPEGCPVPVRSASVAELFPKPATLEIGGGTAPVVVTGSIYLIGEVVEALTCDQPVGEAVLQD